MVSLDADNDERIVISGISGRFPNSDNIAEFQHNLLNKVDCTTVDHDRWEDFENELVPHRIGIVNNVKKFDRVFFGVHSKLTTIMDPTSRMLLESTFEAIMDAGINPRSLKGANVAVFSATCLTESEKTIFHRKVQTNGFGIVGCSKAMVPNRISFFLGLRGPSINIDNACVSSGTALQQAYHSLKHGYTDAAIVATGCLCLHPHVSFQFRKLGLISPDGYTRCYDDNGEGCTRSEGCGVLYLQRASDAKRIYMEVINTRTTHGDSIDYNTVLFPKFEPQVRLMKELLEESNLTADDIAYVEASGLGIKDIDAEELNAIDVVYGKRRKPLLVGSVKSYIGNLLAANTTVGIIKMIIAAETRQIPPNLHYTKPNSKAVGLKEGRLKIPTELTPWTGRYCVVHTLSRHASVSNTILKSPDNEKKNNGVPDDDLQRLVIVSGRTEEACESLLNYFENKSVDAELLQLLYDIFQSDVDGHLYRGYTVVPAKGLMPLNSKKKEILFNTGEKREIWWVFSGMGSQWVGMGEALLKLPVFKAAITKCDAVLKPHGFDIFRIITEKDPKMFDQIINSFVGIAAIQIGLVDVLRSVDLQPDFIIGHSVGELGCAYADGCFTAEQMIMAALSRGLASSESKLIRGSMAAVGLGYAQMKSLCPPDIDVACHNGPNSSTISGPAESMKAFVAELTAKGIFAREVPCSNIAYHSRYIAEAGPRLLERLQKVIPKPNPRSNKWVSTSVPRSEWNTLKARLCSAEYHTNNLLSPVLFDETSKLIPSNAVCLEIAPHGLLQAILKKSLPDSCINVALTKRGHPDNFEVLLAALGKLYNVGLQPQIANLYPRVKYPVSKSTPSISSLIKWDHTADWSVYFYAPLQEVKEGEKTFEINLNDSDAKYLQNNLLDGKLVVPFTLCLSNVWEILNSFNTEVVKDVVFEEIKIFQPLLEVPDNNIVKLTVMIPRGTKKFEVLNSGTLVVAGTIKATKAPNEDRLNVRKNNIVEQAKFELSQTDFYTELEMRGYQHSNYFKGVLKSSIDGTKALVKWDGNWMTFIENAIQLFNFSNDSRHVEVPLIIRKIVIDHNLQQAASKNSEGIIAVLDKKLNYLSAGGLEIQGPKFTVVPKSVEQNKLSVDVANVVSYVDKTDQCITGSLRVALQLVLENTFSSRIPEIELVEQESTDDFKTVLRSVPEVSIFKIETTTLRYAGFKKTLTIITDAPNNYNVKDVSDKLKGNRFLLTVISSKQEDSYVNAAESAGLKVVLIRKSEDKVVLLLRKKQPIDNVVFIKSSDNAKEIINNIKSANLSAANGRVAVVVKSDSKENFISCLDQIERATSLKEVRIFNVQNSKVTDSATLENICKSQLESDLLINILTPSNVWASLRRSSVTLKTKPSNNWVANQKYSNNPYNITWTESPVIENTANSVKVEYAALNRQDASICSKTFFADTAEMSGRNRLAERRIGLEFSGSDAKGNRVMGITDGNALASHVNADPAFTWPVPKAWSFEEAATVPFSYIIAYAALFAKADIQAGEKVLLINSSDGLGLAILNLAVQKKCDVFVIYDSEAERKLILSLAPNLSNNRLLKLSGGSFLDDILLETNGQGVDVIISNYSKVKKIDGFLTAAKRNARVVSINDLNDQQIHGYIGMEIFLKEISFYSLVPKKVLLSGLETKRQLARMLSEDIKSGVVKPLARTIYSRASITDAVDSCIKNKQLGKILVKVQPDGSSKNEAPVIPRLYCSNDKSYVIIEGLTPFGLELIDWLITRGAKHIVITSTQKNETGYQKFRSNTWQSYGVKVVLHKEIDLTNGQSIKALLKDAASAKPVDAIFDLRQLRSSVSSTDSADIKFVDEVSRSTCPELRYFVVCSAAVNAGGLLLMKKCTFVNQISRNETLEKMLEQRRKDGLPALLIKWGIADSVKQGVNKSDSDVILPPVTKYIQKLDEILGTNEIVVEVSCSVPIVNKINEDDDEDDLSNTCDKEAEQFTASLYEQSRVCMDSCSYLQV